MNEIQRKAQELADQVSAQVNEARLDLAKKMIEKGYTSEDHQICDNMLDIIEGRTLEYRCWAVMHNIQPQTTRIPRGDTNFVK